MSFPTNISHPTVLTASPFPALLSLSNIKISLSLHSSYQYLDSNRKKCINTARLVQLPNCHEMGRKLWGPATKIDGFAASLRYLSHRTKWFMAWQHFSNHKSFENKTPVNQGGLVSLKYIKKSLPQVPITSIQHFLKGQHQTTLKGFSDAAIPAFCHPHNGPILSVNS